MNNIQRVNEEKNQECYLIKGRDLLNDFDEKKNALEKLAILLGRVMTIQEDKKMNNTEKVSEQENQKRYPIKRKSRSNDFDEKKNALEKLAILLGRVMTIQEDKKMNNTEKVSEQENQKRYPIKRKSRSNDFDKKKNALKKFSKQLPNPADLPRVPTESGIFGLFSYKVSGKDLNELSSNIQDKMIEQNKLLVRTVKEFSTIYDTFSALDKEYIQGILLSIKAAEEANGKALEGIEGVRSNQQNIGTIIQQQKQVINVLKKFKERVERIEHLSDIDELYRVFSPMPNKVEYINETVEVHQRNINDLEEYVEAISSKQKTVEQKIKAFQQISYEQQTELESLINQLDKKTIQMNNDHISNFVALKQSFASEIEVLSNENLQAHEELGGKITKLNQGLVDSKREQEKRMNEISTKFENQMHEAKLYFEGEISKINDEVSNLTESTARLSVTIKNTRMIVFIGFILISILMILMIGGIIY